VTLKLLLIGGSGRLGSAIKRVLGASYDIAAPGRDELDITNAEQVRAAIEKYRADWVLNLAAYNDVQAAEGDGAKQAVLMNSYAPGLIAAAAHAAGSRTLHVSTNYIFDGGKTDGYTEDDEPKPLNLYGMSKYLGELAVTARDPSAVIVRSSRLYGPKADSENAKRSFVDIIIEDAKQPTFSVDNGEVSGPTLVDDLAKHIDAHIFRASEVAPGIYHMANAGGCTWFQWAQEIVKDLGLNSVVTPRDPNEIKRPARRAAYSMLISTEVPAMRSWQEALADFLKQ
jgi:dTDP-4-dehydrorhamnose reductase